MTVVVTEDIHTPGRILIEMIRVGLERKRRIWELREDVKQYRKILAESKAALAVEETEAEDDARFVRHIFETWRSELESRVMTEAKEESA